MITIKNYQKDDFDSLKTICRQAFDYDCVLHTNKKGGPTGYDDGSLITNTFENDEYECYTIFNDQEVIGGVALIINSKTNINDLYYLFIDPNHVNKGYGQQVWDLIEKKYPETKVWITATPGYSISNHNFYINKLDFKVYRILHPFDENKRWYELEKVIK